MFEGLDRGVHDWRVKRSLNGKRLGLLYPKVTGVLLNEFQGLEYFKDSESAPKQSLFSLYTSL